jgi:beta-lactam-binding protein with PASTA domain
MLKKIFKNKIIKNFTLAFVSSVVIILLVFWWLKVYTNHGEKIETPNFMELTVAEAQELAKDKGLTLVIDSVYNSKRTKGTIFLQNPTPHSDSTNSWVKSGRKIYLSSVRNSVQMIPLPDVDGAELVVIPRLEGRFSFEKDYISGEEKILKCEYKGKEVKTGDMLPRGAKLKLTIGQSSIKKPVSLPKLVGLTLDEANTKLSEKSLTILALYNGCVTKQDTLSAIITRQTPDYTEGRNILEGSEVVVILNRKEDVNLTDSIN